MLLKSMFRKVICSTDSLSYLLMFSTAQNEATRLVMQNHRVRFNELFKVFRNWLFD